HGVDLGREAGGVVGDVDVDAQQPQPLQPPPHLEVRAAHGVAEPGEDGGDPAHGHPPDADDVDLPGGAQVEGHAGTFRPLRRPAGASSAAVVAPARHTAIDAAA